VTLACILIVIAGVAVLLVSDSLGWGRTPGGVAKMIASTAFLVLAWHGGALKSPYGCGLLAGLFLSWWGDLFLIFREPRVFLAGLVSFLLGHVAYVTAFLLYGIAPLWSLAAAGALVAVAIPVVLWLAPKLGDMRAPVYAYIVVISLMVACAACRRGALLHAVDVGGRDPVLRVRPHRRPRPLRQERRLEPVGRPSSLLRGSGYPRLHGGPRPAAVVGAAR